MTPLDDELRTTLRAHAGDVRPAPDPLGGIEARAKGLRRRRTALAATGTALAVAAVALAVPSLVDRDRDRAATQFASSGPTVTSSSATLDPARPWSFRGTPLSTGVMASFQDAWSAKHPGSTLTVLFAQVYEPSQQPEAAIVASGPDGDRYGYLMSLNKGIEISEDQPLEAGTTAITVELPGDEVPRLLVLAAPDSKAVSFASDGHTFTEMASPLLGQDHIGLGIAPLEGETADDRVRVTAADGTVVFDRPARPENSERPTNLLTWEARGGNEMPLVPGMREAFAPSLQTTAEKVNYKVLFAGDTDGGVRFLVGQIWAPDDREVHSFAYAEGGTNGPEVFLGPLTPLDPPVLAFVLGSQPGSTTDLLVVVPTPRTGQVSYDADATGAFTPISGQDYLDGVVLIDRDPRATNDRLEVLDGNGDLDRPNYRGPVAPLLCGAKECG